MWQHRNVAFCQKLLHRQRILSWCVVLVKNPAPCFLSHSSTEGSQSWQIIDPLNYFTFRSPIDMNNASNMGENDRCFEFRLVLAFLILDQTEFFHIMDRRLVSESYWKINVSLHARLLIDVFEDAIAYFHSLVFLFLTENFSHNFRAHFSFWDCRAASVQSFLYQYLLVECSNDNLFQQYPYFFDFIVRFRSPRLGSSLRSQSLNILCHSKTSLPIIHPSSYTSWSILQVQLEFSSQYVTDVSRN